MPKNTPLLHVNQDFLQFRGGSRGGALWKVPPPWDDKKGGKKEKRGERRVKKRREERERNEEGEKEGKGQKGERGERC